MAGFALAADAPSDEAIKKDFKRLEGTWTVVSAEQDGQALDRIKGGILKITDQNFYIKTKSGTEMKGDLRIDPAKKPKTMDLAHQEGLLRDKTWQGIYEVAGDDLKICYVEADKDKERPAEFTTSQDSNRLLVVLKRDKK
jgi:uncharacterized protein (TIGR03067 family)